MPFPTSELGECQFSGEFPPALAQLTSLQQLYLNHNQLTGSLPALSNLTLLSLVTFESNQLSSTMPEFPVSIRTLYVIT